MTFEKFDDSGSGRGRPAGTDPMISVRKSGSIGINQAALTEFFEENGGAVMYYDEESERIGIKPVADKDADEAAYSLTRSDSGGTLAPKAFLRTYGLIPEITTQYDPKWDDDAELVSIDLTTPLKTYGSPNADEDANSDN